MLENQLFPTPNHVAARMVEPWLTEFRSERSLRIPSAKGRRAAICDPQAGTGALLKYVKGNYGGWHSSHEYYACEIDYQLRTVLSEEFDVIGSDWLQYDDPLRFDIIVSNPPFDNGAAHALKNIEHLAPGGRMACLLNAETLRNPCTKERRLLLSKVAMNWGINPELHGLYSVDSQDAYSLLAELGSVGAIAWFGPCFKDAERPTNVEIVCLWYNAPEQQQVGIDWDQGEFSSGPDINSPEFKSNPLAHASAIKTLVAKYRRSLALIEARHQAQEELRFYVDDLSPDYGGRGKLFLDMSFPEQVARLKALYWNTVFTTTDLGNRVGSKAQKNFEEFATTQKKLEFTEANIVEMLRMLLGSIDQVMHQLVADTFDAMVGYHADNKRHSEGWKTNAPGKIKRNKLIFPNGIFYSASTHAGYKMETWKLNKEAFWDDLDKALCWATGRNHKALEDARRTTYMVLHDHLRRCDSIRSEVSYDDLLDSEFFLIRIYKKGTVHLWFKDGNVAKDFQKAANDGRMWLAEHDSAA